MSYTAAEAVRIAKSQIGKRETGTNDTPYNRWLGTIPGYPHGGYGYPWCMSFQSWVASKAGGRANVDYPKTAGCEVGVVWFKNRGRWAGRTPHVGDMVFYGPGGGTHVELVVAVSSSTITTVGGNTGGTLNGAYHEGNGVYQKTVARSSSRIYGYGRPVYAAGQEELDMTPEQVFNAVMNRDAVPAPPGGPSGPNWKASSFLTNTYRDMAKGKDLAQLNAKLDAMQLTIDKLVDALGSATIMTPEQVAALQTEIREAIEGITVRLDTEEETP